jgi:uncharacterized protein (TIGR02246 family)
MKPRLLLLLWTVIFWLLPVFAASGTLKSAKSQDQTPNNARETTRPQESRAAVDEFNRRFVESCRNKDNALAVQLWSDDGVDLLPGMEPMAGKAAISKWLTDLTEQTKGAKMLLCDVNWQKIQISGDVAYEWGINTQTVSLPNQAEPFKNKGKITLILRKQSDGSWKLALESWNSSPRS